MKNKNKTVRRVVAVICICVVLGVSASVVALGINIHILSESGKYIVSTDKAADLQTDCILVLGCGLVDEKTPSPMLADRIDKGIELYKKGASAKLLMSGDHGREGYDEVNVMKARAVNNSVPSEDVFMDHAGFSTYESMYRAKEIFGAKKILIVTQKYHLYRAVYIARSLGLDAWGCASEDIRYAGQLKRGVREAVARCKDYLFVIVKPEPSVLGEKISLVGSGNVTNDENTKNFIAA